MKQAILNNLKNIYGWKTNRKIIVISVDDYGNVRLDSKKARKKMDKAGVKAIAPTFDNLDTLETKEDLELLYEALTSVKDKNGKNAIFTPFALPCNINFEAMAKNGNKEYIYELLPDTYKKLEARDSKAYEGTWGLWIEGIEKKLMQPQFHGREHFNLKVFNEKLVKKDKSLFINLENRSNTTLLKSKDSFIKYSAAFHFWESNEIEDFSKIITTGLDAFEKVFGYRATHFNAPGGSENINIHKYLKDSGIKYIDQPLVKYEPQGKGVFKRKFNYTGKKNYFGLTYQVRNVVFEPINNSSSVDIALRQIEAAFRWNRPAIISSHRVNFCGHIDPKNRKIGISALRELLKNIVLKWPDVEFMSTVELGVLIANNN